MKTVFISGSRSISRFNNTITHEFDCLMANNYDFLIGDANGADKICQMYLAEKNYQRVKIFHVGKSPRNNIGHWEETSIDTNETPGTREYFTAKDISMSIKCDFAFVIWDGKSKGSIQNIDRLLNISKKTRVYHSKFKEIFNISTQEDLENINLYNKNTENLTTNLSLDLCN